MSMIVKAPLETMAASMYYKWRATQGAHPPAAAWEDLPGGARDGWMKAAQKRMVDEMAAAARNSPPEYSNREIRRKAARMMARRMR